MPTDYGHDAERAILQAANQVDPLVKAMQELQHARSGGVISGEAKPALLRAIRSVLDTQDPLLLDSIGLRLVTYRNGTTGRIEMRYGGETYALGGEVDVGAAILLVPCHIGMQCDAAEPRADMRCASGQGCEGGRFEEVKAMVSGKPGAYEKILNLSQRMAESVSARDAAMFAP